MTDPRDFDRRMDMERQAEMERTTGTSTPWGWIAAAVFVIVILALARRARTLVRQPPPAWRQGPRRRPSPFLRDRRRRQTGRAGNSSDEAFASAPRLDEPGC